ncbi:MAG: ribokinase [Sphingobium sp.]
MTVCILGSINIDHVARVEAMPRPGETIQALSTFDAPGGKGANQAVAAARAGAATRMFGAVGGDMAGTVLRDRLAAAGVDVSGVAILPGMATGTAFITLSEDGENSIIFSPNANAHAVAPDAAALSGGTVALAQLETPVAGIAAFFGMAGDMGAVRMLNTAPALPEARRLFDRADILLFNEIELAFYLNGNAGEGPEAARRLLTRPGQRAVVTLGARGAVMVDAQAFLHAPASPVERIVDTTGAGDAFCGTLAALVARGGGDWPAMLAAANEAAAQCVQRQGAT